MFFLGLFGRRSCDVSVETIRDVYRWVSPVGDWDEVACPLCIGCGEVKETHFGVSVQITCGLCRGLAKVSKHTEDRYVWWKAAAELRRQLGGNVLSAAMATGSRISELEAAENYGVASNERIMAYRRYLLGRVAKHGRRCRGNCSRLVACVSCRWAGVNASDKNKSALSVQSCFSCSGSGVTPNVNHEAYKWGSEFRNWREAAGLTMRQVAAAAGIPIQAVYRSEIYALATTSDRYDLDAFRFRYERDIKPANLDIRDLDDWSSN